MDSVQCPPTEGHRLVSYITSLLATPPPKGCSRWLVAIAGPPASGKTTLADHLASLVNASRSSPSAPRCAVVPMDGYHLTRAQLDAHPTPALAHARRGAPWTFDPLALSEKLSELATSEGSVTVHAFDHARKDPDYDAITVPADARVVIVEGLYLLLSLPPWNDAISPRFHARAYLSCPPSLARARGAPRNFAAGISPSLAASQARWDASDAVNGWVVSANIDKSRLDFLLTQEDGAALAAAATGGVQDQGAGPLRAKA